MKQRGLISCQPPPEMAMASLLLAVLSIPIAMSADEALRPWSTNVDPADVTRSYMEEITTGRHEYKVVQAGTMDGRNCRSPMGCGIAREGSLLQSWESNRSVRMENVGNSDINNPWLSNGNNNFRTVSEIASRVLTPEMADSEKAFALWFQEIQYRHHDGGDNNELLDPVKVFNIYGYNTCGNDSICLATLWRAAGMKTRPAEALGHCVSQAFYDDRWHFYDGDMDCVYLTRDNETVASEQDIVRDHDLVKRTHSKGILMPDTWWDGQGMCAMYFRDANVTFERGHDDGTTMNMVLRPGESIVWRWGQLGPVKYHGALMTTPTYPLTICDGLWEYRPDFSNEIWRNGASTAENITSGPDGLSAAEETHSTIIWTMRSPYVFVGGRIEAEGTNAQFSYSADGKTWRLVKDDLDKCFPVVGPAIYEYKLKCQLEGPARLRRLAIINDLQMAPMALPEMAVGENPFTYTDQTTGGRRVRVTHQWVERSTSMPPPAPQAAIYPPDGGEANGTDIAFQWAATDGVDGEGMGDYCFELSSRPDMRWPLSMDFYKLISRTADVIREKDKTTVKAQYTLPQAGLLTPDRQYYWRVRAMNSQGVWGPWGKTWSFTPRGPAWPMNVTVDFDSNQNVGTLRWQANTLGRKPAKYRVYGSDEKGFTVADQNYQGTVGVTEKEMAAWNPWFPANFIGETTATEMPVEGPGVASPAANKTFYRVVAVDDEGKRSGPSDYASGPRPVIYTKPVTTARVGAGYSYQACATRSIGDLTSRMKGDQQVSGYFDIEKPVFTLAQAPGWLKIDEASGMLSGTPDKPGGVEVAVTATIDRQVRNLDDKVLVWGNEKVLSADDERIGAATQNFVIEVQ